MSGSSEDKITYKRRAIAMVGLIVTLFTASVVALVVGSRAIGLV